MIGRTVFPDSLPGRNKKITVTADDASKVYETAEFLIKEKEHIHLVTDFLMTFLQGLTAFIAFLGSFMMVSAKKSVR